MQNSNYENEKKTLNVKMTESEYSEWENIKEKKKSKKVDVHAKVDKDLKTELLDFLDVNPKFDKITHFLADAIKEKLTLEKAKKNSFLIILQKLTFTIY